MKCKANLLLLTTAAIWGLAFVAQRAGMEFIGPFTFNGIRFALGGLSLIPLMVYYRGRADGQGTVLANSWRAGIAAGAILFIAASLQQIGLIYTTAGKAAFITCLYIVLVPLASVFLRQRIACSTWLGSVLAVAGLYLLCVKESFVVAYGDWLEAAGAAFWTAHILLIDRFVRRTSFLQLAFTQVMTCAALSMLVAAVIETITPAGILQAGVQLLYGGVCSVGIAYTLQIIGQKNAPPAHAAIILSMETVFAVLGGWFILGEQLASRELAGCVFMLAGMLLAQVSSLPSQNKGGVEAGS
ncbi:DMT family transporter|uniref:Threonine/homoserine efflux transporter RhtA n=1 Tax=Dendrosporobacter quercicolus TaxID=146817 RepID=A0A1G9T704_9FIRM|nr:DMT family transporter [Dendrosporobacter quercicolus]NSL48524.1 DMT family transporter [Dendrosporobacter quercicolus DSM 1736]SDM43454.1 Threonine/homoserine efflux transporter RhtA [Dendrosporobacter quercicolus]